MDGQEAKPGENPEVDITSQEGQDDPGTYFDLEGLAKAAEEVMNEVEEGDSGKPPQEEHELEEEHGGEAPEKPEKPEKPEDDNAERSRLGRRIANMEREHQKQLTELTTLVQQQSMLLAQLLQGGKPNEQPGDEDDDNELLPTTRKEFNRYLDRAMEKRITERQIAQQQSDRKYQTAYLDTLKSIEDREPNAKLASKVIEVMVKENSPFNLRHTGDPRVDARLNFAEAKAEIIARVVATAKAKGNPLKGNPPKAPLGTGSSGSGSPPQNKPLPKLNPYAQSAAKFFNLTPDEVVKVLGED